MFENVKAGWRMGSAVRKLVFNDRKLLLFPIMSGIVILLETVAIFLTFFLSHMNSNAFYIMLPVYYVVVYFTSAYILVAMLIAFKGNSGNKRMSIGDAFSKTYEYKVQILEWALFESIITMIIRVIEQRLGLIGSVIFGLATSIAISIATTFAIPVIIEKKTGPVATLKSSTQFIINNFGKTFGGLAYTDLYSLLFVLAGVGVIFIGIMSVFASVVLGIVIAVLGVMLMAYGMMLGYTLMNVYKFVLYDAMNGGKLPEGITMDMVNGSIKKAKQRRSIFGGSVQ